MIPETIQRELDKELGRAPTSLLVFLLSERLFHYNRDRLMKIQGNWVLYATSPRIERITGMATRTQQRAFNKLKAHDLITIYHRPIEAYNAPRKVIINDEVLSGLLVELCGKRSVRNFCNLYIEPFLPVDSRGYLISVPLWRTKEKRTRTRDKTRTNSLGGQSGTQSKDKRSVTPPTDLLSINGTLNHPTDNRVVKRATSTIKIPIKSPRCKAHYTQIAYNVFLFDQNPNIEDVCSLFGYMLELDEMELSYKQDQSLYWFCEVNGGDVKKRGYEAYNKELLILVNKVDKGQLHSIKGVCSNGAVFDGYTLPIYFPTTSTPTSPEILEKMAQLGIKDKVPPEKLLDQFEKEFGTPFYRINHGWSEIPDEMEQSIYKNTDYIYDKVYEYKKAHNIKWYND